MQLLTVLEIIDIFSVGDFFDIFCTVWQQNLLRLIIININLMYTTDKMLNALPYGAGQNKQKYRHCDKKLARNRYFQKRRGRSPRPREAYDTIRYDSRYLTCSKKLTGSQLSLPHGTNKKLKYETKNKTMSMIGPV